MSLQYPYTCKQHKHIAGTMATEHQAITGADLEAVLNKVSENQLKGITTLQNDNKKHFETQITQLTKAILDSHKDTTDGDTTSPSKGIPKPETFSGQITENFTSWLQQFTSIATLNKWSPTARAQLLHTFLRRSALTFLQGLPSEIQTNFNDAIAALKKEYDDSTIKNTLHIDLHNRKQGLRESVSEYCSDLESRFLRLNIAEEYYKLLVLLDGLQPHLTYEVRKTGPTTYTQAKELARNIKAALHEQTRKSASAVSAISSAAAVDTPHIQSTQLHQQIDGLQRQLQSMQASINRLQSTRPFPKYQQSKQPSNVKSTHHPNPPSRTPQGLPVCNFCHKKGHVATQCYHRKSSQPQSSFVPTVILIPRKTPDDPFPTGGDKGRPTTISSQC